MICAACNEPTATEPCTACGESPLLDGRWRLEALIGQGAAGTTWRAVHLADGAVVAVKELPLWRISDEKHRELASREARVLRELKHPGIPRFVADLVAGRGKGRALFLVQEYVDGPDLGAEMAGHRYDQAEVLAILDEILGILDYLHELSPPVVHRDVKPKNVMRRRDGRLVLVDFGSVRDALKTDLGGSTVAGTFGYMAPEQFLGEATAASDLYAVGALAVALLTRLEPHTLLDHTPRVVWEPHAKVTDAFAALLHDLLAKDPKRRPVSAKAARERVRAVQQGLRSGPQVQRAAVTRGSWEDLPVEARVIEKQRPEPPELPELPAPWSAAPAGMRPAASPPASKDAARALVGSAAALVAVLVLVLGVALVGIGGLLASAPSPAPPPAFPIAPAAPQGDPFADTLRSDPQLQACFSSVAVEGPVLLIVTIEGDRATSTVRSEFDSKSKECATRRVHELRPLDGVFRHFVVEVPH